MPWLAGALAPDWTVEDLAGHVERGEAVVVTRGEAPIGIVVALVGTPEADAACVAFIAIDPAERFRGLGGEAALALEGRLRERAGVGRVLAAVPEQRGLAVYFWLRLGYRPLVQTEAPWPLVGLNGKGGRGIWMERASRRLVGRGKWMSGGWRGGGASRGTAAGAVG